MIEELHESDTNSLTQAKSSPKKKAVKKVPPPDLTMVGNHYNTETKSNKPPSSRYKGLFDSFHRQELGKNAESSEGSLSTLIYKPVRQSNTLQNSPKAGAKKKLHKSN